jgi:hypothetical protein
LNQTCNTISKVIIAYSWTPQKTQMHQMMFQGKPQFFV